MDELEGRRLKAAILQEEVSDDVWERLIPYADGLLKAIKAFYQYTHIYDHPQTPANLCYAVNTLGQTKPGKVVRFKRRSA